MCRVDANRIVKVADFGLSRDLFSRDYYRIEDGKTPLPVRWMAPESLNRSIFTTTSDVVSSVYQGVRGWSVTVRRSPVGLQVGGLQDRGGSGMAWDIDNIYQGYIKEGKN